MIQPLHNEPSLCKKKKKMQKKIKKEKEEEKEEKLQFLLGPQLYYNMSFHPKLLNKFHDHP